MGARPWSAVVLAVFLAGAVAGCGRGRLAQIIAAHKAGSGQSGAAPASDAPPRALSVTLGAPSWVPSSATAGRAALTALFSHPIAADSVNTGSVRFILKRRGAAGAENDNQLWGDFFQLVGPNSLAVGESDTFTVRHSRNRLCYVFISGKTLREVFGDAGAGTNAKLRFALRCQGDAASCIRGTSGKVLDGDGDGAPGGGQVRHEFTVPVP